MYNKAPLQIQGNVPGAQTIFEYCTFEMKCCISALNPNSQKAMMLDFESPDNVVSNFLVIY